MQKTILEARYIEVAERELIQDRWNGDAIIRFGLIEYNYQFDHSDESKLEDQNWHQLLELSKVEAEHESSLLEWIIIMLSSINKQNCTLR